MSNITGIEIHCDNNDDIKLSRKDFTHLHFGQMVRTLDIEPGINIDVWRCSEFRLRILPSGNTRFFSLALGPTTVFERLSTFYDIVGVALFYDNGRVEHVLVPYDKEMASSRNEYDAETNKNMPLIISLDMVPAFGGYGEVGEEDEEGEGDEACEENEKDKVAEENEPLKENL